MGLRVTSFLLVMAPSVVVKSIRQAPCRRSLLAAVTTHSLPLQPFLLPSIMNDHLAH